jgi:uncharacterized protein YlxP (DUF503 family)
VASFVVALDVELQVPQSASLKQKRSVIKSIIETARHRYGVAAAEVDHQDTWQRAGLCFAAVSGTAGHAADVVDEVERFVWAHPEIEVLSVERRWLE